MIRLHSPLIAVLVLTIVSIGNPAWACPFCSAVSQTLRQEMSAMDAVAIAVATAETVRNEETGQIALKVKQVLKGEELVKPEQEIRVVYYGAVEPGRKFMISGADPQDLQWACLPITDVSEQYLLDVAKLPDDPLERLKFYQPYLQHPDGMLNRDAYDEFAITPYSAVQALKPFMNHDQLLAWVQDPEMPADRKRLYLTMLGVCGTKQDLPILRELLNSTQATTRGGLDALIACYLVLAGEEGLPLIDEMFLKNPKAPYADTYAAIMAIRFHGTDTNVIPRSALVQSLHHVLERKDLADLVIPDLARWGDWTQIDRLVQLFIDAEKDNNWIRVPVVNYLRACPEPQAAEALEKLKKIDPDSVRRAGAVFSIPAPAPAAKTPATSSVVPGRVRAKDALLMPFSPAYAKHRPDSRTAALAFAPRTEHAFAIAAGLAPQPVRANHLPEATLMNRSLASGVPAMLMASLLMLFLVVFSGGGRRTAASTY